MNILGCHKTLNCISLMPMEKNLKEEVFEKLKFTRLNSNTPVLYLTFPVYQIKKDCMLSRLEIFRV